MVTNSLSFANSEFTFSNNLRLNKSLDSGIASFTQTLLSGLNLPATDGGTGAIAVRNRDVGVADWVPEINFTHIARDDSKCKLARALGVLWITRVNPRSQRIVKEENMVDDDAVLLNKWGGLTGVGFKTTDVISVR